MGAGLSVRIVQEGSWKPVLELLRRPVIGFILHIESRERVRVRDYLSLVISDSTGQPYDRVSGVVGCTV